MLSTVPKPATRLTLEAVRAADLMADAIPCPIPPTATVAEATALLSDRGISATPSSTPAAVGVVSKTDILIHDRELVRGGARRTPCRRGNYDASRVLHLSADIPAAKVVEQMLQLNVASFSSSIKRHPWSASSARWTFCATCARSEHGITVIARCATLLVHRSVDRFLGSGAEVALIYPHVLRRPATATMSIAPSPGTGPPPPRSSTPTPLVEQMTLPAFRALVVQR